jgi:hypothetical protein
VLGALLDDGDLDGHGGLKGLVSGWLSAEMPDSRVTTSTHPSLNPSIHRLVLAQTLQNRIISTSDCVVDLFDTSIKRLTREF